MIVPDIAKAAVVSSALEKVDGVAGVSVLEKGKPGIHLAVTLKSDPYSTTAYELIPDLRKTAKAAGGAAVLVGGQTAIQADLRTANERDAKVIPPIVLIVVFLILALLLRALVAPFMLILTVLLSFGATLGLSALAFKYIFDFPGSDPSLVLYAFIFLVALGVDYNIFLMARAHEESAKHGTHSGMLRALSVTGAVITSAGIVLAGTFLVLGTLPVVSIAQIGLTVALGVLLDTFLVRSILVPALTLDIGDKVWWPSALGHRGNAPDPKPNADDS